MPSLRHHVLAFALPRVLGSRELVDEASERASIVARQRQIPDTLPTAAVPGFFRHFDLARERLVSDTGVAFTSYVITPKNAVPSATLFYVHGGAFVSPIDKFHVRYVTRLSSALGLRVVLPQYPLAPEHTWRDSVPPLTTSVDRWLAKSPGGLILGGDSAGGGLALAVALRLRAEGRSMPRRLLLHAPWGDLTTSTPETKDYARVDTWLKYSKLIAYARWWAGSESDLGRSEVSPTLADFDGLPPALVLAGTRDLLLPGCRLLADRAAKSDWDLTYLERQGLVHVFALMPFIPEARHAFGYTIRYLKKAGF
ncbi:MAG: alpha/beta hydrolase [Nocardioides sp.]